MRGNSHVRFLGGGGAEMPCCYPTRLPRAAPAARPAHPKRTKPCLMAGLFCSSPFIEPPHPEVEDFSIYSRPRDMIHYRLDQLAGNIMDLTLLDGGMGRELKRIGAPLLTALVERPGADRSSRPGHRGPPQLYSGRRPSDYCQQLRLRAVPSWRAALSRRGAGTRFSCSTIGNASGKPLAGRIRPATTAGKCPRSLA